MQLSLFKPEPSKITIRPYQEDALKDIAHPPENETDRQIWLEGVYPLIPNAKEKTYVIPFKPEDED